MKKADIKIGDHYAVQHSTYGPIHRAKIVGTKMLAPRYSGYGSKPTSGWVIELDGGRLESARSQAIIRPWAEQQELDGAAARHKRQARDDRRAMRIQRAAATHGLIELYRALGLEDKEGWISAERNDSPAVLAAHLTELGFTARVDEGKHSTRLFVTAPHESVILYLLCGTSPTIPREVVPDLVEAAKVFL